MNRFNEGILIKSFAGPGFKNPRRDQIRLATASVELSSPCRRFGEINESIFQHRVPQTPRLIGVPFMAVLRDLRAGLRHMLINAKMKGLKKTDPFQISNTLDRLLTNGGLEKLLQLASHCFGHFVLFGAHVALGVELNGQSGMDIKQIMLHIKRMNEPEKIGLTIMTSRRL